MLSASARFCEELSSHQPPSLGLASKQSTNARCWRWVLSAVGIDCHLNRAVSHVLLHVAKAFLEGAPLGRFTAAGNRLYWSTPTYESLWRV